MSCFSGTKLPSSIIGLPTSAALPEWLWDPSLLQVAVYIYLDPSKAAPSHAPPAAAATFLPALLRLLGGAGEEARDRDEVWALVLQEEMGKTEKVGLWQGGKGVPWRGPCPTRVCGVSRVGMVLRKIWVRIARAIAAAVAGKGHPCLPILARIVAVMAALGSGWARGLPGLGSTSSLPHSMGWVDA